MYLHYLESKLAHSRGCVSLEVIDVIIWTF